MIEKIPFLGNGDGKSLDELDDETIDEAIKIIEENDTDPTKDKIKRVANDQLEVKEADKGEFKIGFVQDREESTINDQELIAPDVIAEHSSFGDMGYLEREDRYVRILTITNWPSQIRPGVLDALYTTNANIRVCQHVVPRDIQSTLKRLKKQLNRLWAKRRSKRDKGKQGTQEEQEKEDRILNLIWAIITGKAKLFDFSIYIEIVAKDKNTLDTLTKNVINTLSQREIKVDPTERLMTKAQDAVAPAARDSLKGSRTLMTETNVGYQFPFIGPELVNPDGVFYGNEKGGKPIFFDPYDMSAYIDITTGKQGSGKSFSKKYELFLLQLKNPDYPVWVIDPKGDFRDLARKIGGDVIRFDSGTRINPLEITTGAIDQIDDPWKNKLRTVLGMYRTHFGDEWNTTVRAVLSRIVRLSYYRKGITPNPATHHKEPPIIQDHIEIARAIANRRPPTDFIELAPGAYDNREEVWKLIADTQNRMSDEDADVSQFIYNALESFGPYEVNSNLNGQTNVDLDNNFIVFDMEAFADTGKAPLIMYVLLDLIYQQCSRTKEPDMVAVDEAHYMLNNKDALDFWNLFARHHRHSNTRISLLSQTMSEFLVEKDDEDKRREIYKTADMRKIFYHDNVSEIAADFHDFTTPEINFIESARQGEKAGSSEYLFDVSDADRVPVELDVSPYAVSICDEDLDPWEWLYENGHIDADTLSQLRDNGLAEEYNVPDQVFTSAGVPTPAGAD